MYLLITFFLSTFVNISAYGYFSISAGAFQGYQVVKQTETLYKTTTFLASLPMIGIQFHFQTTLVSQLGLRFKYEQINVKYQTPPAGFLSAETFSTTNLVMEIPYQHTIHWQSFIKIAQKERILFNIDENIRLSIYKSACRDYGYGINYDSQNTGGWVYGAGSTLSLLSFKSKDINDVPDKNYGYDFEMRAKLGWLYENGWGNIFRAIYSNFYMPNTIDTNNGTEIRLFGELLKSF